MRRKFSVFCIAVLLVFSVVPAVVYASGTDTASSISSASDEVRSDLQSLQQSQAQSSESDTPAESVSLIPMLIRVSVVIIVCELVAVCVIIVIKKKRTIR